MLCLVTGSNLFGYRYWNVTQDKYEAALAKWHSLPIEEYEETLTLTGSGTWKIVVQVERTNGVRVEKVQSVESLDETAANLEKRWGAEEFEKYWTVDALFRGISHLLEHPEGLDPNFEEFAIDFTWVEFDPDMGYLNSYTKTHNRTEVLQYVSVDVRVLK
jgi:hypothetical protein